MDSIAFVSDIHMDFYIPPKLSGTKLDKKIDEFIEHELWLKNADILIIAGDNSHYNQQNKILLEKIAAKKMYKKIFVTFGNHDLYLVSNAQKSKYKTSFDKLQELKDICKNIDDVEFLDGNVVDVDGIKIGGTGAWYDFSYGKKYFNMSHFAMMQKWKDTMNDANLIEGFDKPEEINDIRGMYEVYSKHYKKYTFDPILFFKQEEAKILKIIEECDIFVTHVGPVVPPHLKSEYMNSMTGFYYFDGEYLLNKKNAPSIWIFGHTHDSYDFKINNTQLLCNPLGYKSENKNAEVQIIYLDEFKFKKDNND